MSQIQNAYLDAKVRHQVLEQQTKQCSDVRLLPGLNFQLEQSAIAVEKLFWAWSVEVDGLLNQPVLPEIPVTHLKVVAGWWQSEDVNRTPGAA